MPISVAMAPGPNMIGIASGTKATSTLPLPPLGTDTIEAGDEYKSNPIFIRMIPPTMRTMLSGTPKMRSMRLPKHEKEQRQERGVDARATGQAAVRRVVGDLRRAARTPAVLPAD